MKKNIEIETIVGDEGNLLQAPIEEDINIRILSDDTEFVISAAKNKDEEDETDDDDDYYHEEDEEKENPFDREPTDKELDDSDIPIVNPEDDLLDDEEEIPLN
ncbi:MAG: hypothetical protein IIA49_00695 [Bacteroidetes bacterium]|nr:hypothetical protein [Bacteroidota bacterium]MCH7769530.1 hypothetical protein [Bacteroidota bacterium]